MQPQCEDRSRLYELFLCELSNSRVSDATALRSDQLPAEISLQILWLNGAMGREFDDDRGRRVRILEVGTWNRGAGPDFLNAVIEINGESIKGDIELDPRPEDWERHGHGANPEFNNVALHVACLPPSRTWFTRNERHESVPFVMIPDEIMKDIIDSPGDVHREQPPPACRSHFAALNEQELVHFLQSAAHYRLSKKKQAWQQHRLAAGEDQALYERLAETLGYSRNRDNMKHLAKRAPLANIQSHPESLLFGTAGFLVPVLPKTCDAETRVYHKNLWDHWWKNRERFALEQPREFHWVSGNIRPANHPQRRLAALAQIVAVWAEFKPLCRLETKDSLIRLMTALEHQYWSKHVTLPSALLSKPLKLIGRDRALDFIVNHVAAMDESQNSWEAYLALPGGAPSTAVIQTASSLLEHAGLVTKLTRKAYMQQAFLQIHHDFCSGSYCSNCVLPAQQQAFTQDER